MQSTDTAHSTLGSRIVTRLAARPRLIGALLALVALLATQGAAAAENGMVGIGP
ncbi:hypothetical protein RYH80_14250 [Halobaculum sp. MBLA0147]|uniref:DUF7503 family protein n=1 Tax=Halobaculum sp. MBLA0147 TaxID=3079934 RepID=UPI003525041B